MGMTFGKIRCEDKFIDARSIILIDILQAGYNWFPFGCDVSIIFQQSVKTKLLLPPGGFVRAK
jgi:hypothetical protein